MFTSRRLLSLALVLAAATGCGDDDADTGFEVTTDGGMPSAGRSEPSAGTGGRTAANGGGGAAGSRAGNGGARAAGSGGTPAAGSGGSTPTSPAESDAGSEPEPTQQDDAGTADVARYDYANDVSPIIAMYCVGCHRPGGPGPFSLESYEAVRDSAPQVAAALSQRIMPPCPDDRPVGSCSPPDAQIAIVVEWAASSRPLEVRD